MEASVDEQILRYLTGRATPSEAAELEAWRGRSQANEAHFQQTARAWELSGVNVPAEALRPPTAAELLEAAHTASSRSSTAGAPNSTRRVAAGVLALAATLAGVALGIRVIGSGVPTATPLLTVASAGTERMVDLQDGSWVRLAPGARLEVHSLSETRRVGLQGRAFFAIAHDAERPFEVTTALGTTRVLGTRFEVRDSADDLRVVVVEGLVSVTVGARTERVPARSVARASADGTLDVEVVDDPHALLRWQSGLLYFQSTPLADVAAEVERWSGRSVIVRDAALAQRRVTVSFEEEPFEEVMAVLCEVVGAVCEIDAEGALVGVPGADR